MLSVSRSSPLGLAAGQVARVCPHACVECIELIDVVQYRTRARRRRSVREVAAEAQPAQLPEAGRGGAAATRHASRRTADSEPALSRRRTRSRDSAPSALYSSRNRRRPEPGRGTRRRWPQITRPLSTLYRVSERAVAGPGRGGRPRRSGPLRVDAGPGVVTRPRVLDTSSQPAGRWARVVWVSASTRGRRTSYDDDSSYSNVEAPPLTTAKYIRYASPLTPPLTQRGRGEHLFWIHTHSPPPDFGLSD